MSYICPNRDGKLSVVQLACYESKKKKYIPPYQTGEAQSDQPKLEIDNTNVKAQ